MLDKSIPYRDIIMRADRVSSDFSLRLPENVSIKTYDTGDEKEWAAIETSVGEFDCVIKAEERFAKDFLGIPSEARRRCFFALSPQGEYAGTCSAWFERTGKNETGLLHWFAVRPEYQGMGIGTALLKRVMQFFVEENTFPVYLHTQTWSHKAIRLYVKAGFCILKDAAFYKNGNDYEQAVTILRSVVPADMLQKWIDASR
jgi:ribosomal protein S18 acetylase RimI-like enzyme